MTPFARTALALALVVAPAAHATNGYFAHGYGVRSLAAAGVAAALPQDALVIATNPAGLTAVGSRLDLGVQLFAPERSSTITGNAFGPDQSFDGNGTELFVIPEFGYNRSIGDNLAVGLAVYGNGGMNTDYASNPLARFGSTGRAYMNMEQLFIAPAIAWKPAANHSIGIALNLGYQRFEVQGLSAFAGFSAAPGALTNNGPDSATGAGVRVGWLGELTEDITVGASWQSKTYMSEFDQYAGLFAGQGDFDVPETFVAGIALRPNDAVTIGLDWQTIKYNDVAAVGNSINNLFAGNPLGSDNGPGFGWQDMKVVKLGAVYAHSDRLTLRAGFSHGGQPIPAGETLFNVIAPGVVEDHVTLGGSWKTGGDGELSVVYAHAFGKTVNGTGSIPPGMPPAGFGGGEASGKLAEDILGIAWTIKY